jgi:cytochrome P450
MMLTLALEDELHIFDWDAYSQVFRAGSRFNRDLSFYNNPQLDGSILNTADGEVAKPHKHLYTAAFSKSAVQRLEPLIHEKLGLFLTRLDGFSYKGTKADISAGFTSLTGDLVMHYCYQRNFGFLDEPDFDVEIINSMREFGAILPMFWYFPGIGANLGKIIDRLSPATQKKYFPAAAALTYIVDQCRERISTLSSLPPSSPELKNSIFKIAVHPDKEKGQYVATPQELTGDAVLMFLAGTDTTANALTLGTYRILANPAILSLLRAELDAAMPDISKFYAQAHLETLPYLRAVVKESLRLSYGTTARLMRIAPPEGASMCGRHIPGGTRVSFSHVLYNNDEKVFAAPEEFRPERWLVRDVTELENRMVSFSRGSRSCLGIK